MSLLPPPVVVAQLFNCSKESLWHAITRHDQMIQWFFENIPEFKPEVGFETGFDVDTGARVFPHRWKITEVVKFNRIVYDWQYAGYPGRALVFFELLEQQDGCKLILKHEVTEPFPLDIPEFSSDSCRNGWEYFIRERLADFIRENKGKS